MKKQNPSIKAQIIRSAFILLSLIAVCAIPFALAQRNAAKRSAQSKKAPAPSQSVMSPGGVLPPLSPWTVVAPYPSSIESPAVTNDATFAYSAGGFDPAFGVTNAFYKYNPVANTWTGLANVPTACYDAGIAYAANTNKIYVFGGIDATSTVLSTNQVY